jgi:3-deoxy-D-manno-octulosonate 8-phosphate phosphatase (KDO 8-P phosphatase)
MKYPEILSQIKTIIFDVDGVLTDGTVLLQPSGDQSRRMNIKDGFALQLAVKKGLRIAVISGGKSEMVRNRFKGLGIYDVYLGASDKWDAFDELCITYNLKYDEIAYMGDDIPDYKLIQTVGLGCCPNDAAPEIQEVADYISPLKGGEGCGRDIIEKVMRAQGLWFDPKNNQDSHIW